MWLHVNVYICIKIVFIYLQLPNILLVRIACMQSMRCGLLLLMSLLLQDRLIQVPLGECDQSCGHSSMDSSPLYPCVSH